MNKFRVFLKKYWIYMVAFILPFGILLLHCFLSKSWMFGSGTLLRGDMSHQFIPFYYGLWDKVHNGGSFSYTWYTAGGCDFNVILGYLMSPFTLLVLIFPENCIVDVVQLIMALKWVLVSVAMVYFFYHTKHNTLKCHKKAVSLFLGLAFGMGSGMINFVGYIQFMDVMICFPFLLLLVEKIVDEKRWKLYYLVLTYCIFTQYYLTFGICIMLLLWFVLQFNKETKEKKKKFFLFAGSSVLSACTCAGSMVAGFVLASDRVQTANKALQLAYVKDILLSPVDFIKQLFILEPISEQYSRDPNIYFSIIGVMLTLFFVFIKIGKKRKAYMLGIAVLFIASYFFGGLSIIWHCFSVPNSVYHRFTNLFVFMMLLFVLYVLIHLEELKMHQVLLVGIVSVAAFFVTFFKIEDYNSYIVYLATILLIALYVMLFILYCRKSITYHNMLLTIVVFGILELSVNVYYAFDDYEVGAFFSSDTNAVIQLSEEAELDLGERVDYVQTITNMGMITSKDTDTGFLSSINGYNLGLHTQLGMVFRGSVSYCLSGASPLINLIYNTQYGIGNSSMQFSDAELVEENGNYQLYKMKRLAGLGYMVQDSVLDWDIYDVDGFDLQDAFVKDAVGGDEIFHVVQLENLSCKNLVGSLVEPDIDALEEGWYYYKYKNQYGNTYDNLQVSFTAENDIEDLYWFGRGTEYFLHNVFVDGELRYMETTASPQTTIHIGKVEKGQEIVIYVYPLESEGKKGTDVEWAMQFAEFDEDAYAKAYELLSKNVYDVETFEDDYVKGSIHVDEDGIMMTSIQASEGFEVFVDGEKTEYEIVGNTMIGVPLSAGEHEVEFKYHTPRVLAADVLSLCCLGVFILLCILGRREKKSQSKPFEIAEE